MDTDLFETATRDAARAINQRLEYVLLGAWRAGYDVVHIYDEAGLGQADLAETFAVQFYALEGYKGDPRPDPPGFIYRHTYDITSVPDDVIRDAVRGELEPPDF